MARIPDAVKAEILARSDIVALIRESEELRRSGSGFVCLCPFHPEKTPSFHVNPGRQIFHCFGCGKGGDAFTWLMEREGMTFPEAARELGRRVGVEVRERILSSEEAEQERRRSETREWVARANELACSFWEQALWSPQGENARAYLEGRGLKEETIRAHRVGYAPGSWDALTSHLAEQRVPERFLAETGLVQPRKQGGFYDRFRDRVITPVFDLRGRVVAASGRLLDPQAEAAKYINSPETVLFRKGRSLFGLHAARSIIRQRGHAILVEGNFDLLTLHQEGYSQTVAPLGTALTEEQVRLIRRFTARVYLCYDGDRAGRQSAMKTVELWARAEFDARLVELPDGEDPDSFLRSQGSHAFDELLKRATSLVDARIRSMAPPPGAPIEERVQAWEGLAPVLGAIPREPVRSEYLRLAAEALLLDEQWIRAYIKRFVRGDVRDGGLGSGRLAGRREETHLSARRLLESGSGRAAACREETDFSARRLLELLVDFPDLIARAARAAILDALPEQSVKEALRVLFRLSEEEGPPTPPRLLACIEDPKQRLELQELLASGGVSFTADNAAEALEEIISTLKRRGLGPSSFADAAMRRAVSKGDEASVRAMLMDRQQRARERESYRGSVVPPSTTDSDV